MSLRPFIWILVCLGLLLPAASGAGQRVQLVLDGSGSMWGRIGDQPKIDIARGAIAEMLDGWDAEVELGLTVYGHRRKGDCNDIETLIPAGPADPRAFLESVRGVSPKGKTPLSEAVRRAAADLRHHEEKAAVVLVSDGLETCDADPCAVAAELAESGVDFTVHVVGFDLKEGEGDKLRCIAKNTGGNFWLASDAAGLTDAFTKVAEVVTAPTPPPPAPEPAPKAVEEVYVEPAPEVVPTVQPDEVAPEFQGVKLLARMSEGGEVVDGGLVWTILSPEKDFEGNHEKRGYKYNGGTEIFTLAPGKHLVRVDYGNVSRQQVIDVKTGDGETFEFNLDAARFKVTGTLNAGGMELSGVEWTVLGLEVDFDGNRQKIAYQYNAGPGHIFTIPSGRFELFASFGNASAKTPFEVTAGEKKALELPLNAAQVRLGGILGDGGEAQSGVEWSVMGLETDFEGNRQRVAYQYNAGPDHMFTIPEGSYELVANYGSISRGQPLTVKAGERKRVTVNLTGGVVQLDMKPSETHAALSGVEWSVYDAAGGRIAYQYNAGPAHMFTLPAGTFRIVASGGGFTGETTTTVEAGQQKVVTVIGAPQS